MIFLFRQHENTSVNKMANSPNHLWEKNVRHNFYCFVSSLICDKTFSLKRYTTVAFSFFNIKHYNTPMMQAQNKAYMPSLVQRARRDTAIPILDLGYRWQWGWSHHIQPIYTHAGDQVLNIEEARWAPRPAWMRMVKRISCPIGVWASVSHTSYPLQTSLAQ